jgi:hypothetical protein
MSDAGKVLIDANGDFIRGVGGVVLADDLYPMVPNHTVKRYSRKVVNDDAVCPASEIWSKSWFEDDGTDPDIGIYFGGYLNVIDSTHGFCFQGVIQITIAENTIEWTRVKSIKVQVDWEWFLTLKKAGWDCKVTRAMNTGAIPANTNIRDTWTLVETLTSAADDGTFYMEFPTNGVEPTSLEIAFFIDISSCSATGEALCFVYEQHAPRIIYNLAT